MVSYGFLIWRLPFIVIGILCVLNVSGANSRNYQVLALSWLSQNGGPLINGELASSFMAIAIAINHFNTRNGSILPFLSEDDDLRNCNATLELINGTLIDDEGLSSVAMSKFVHTLMAETPVDMIHGPSRSEASQTVAIAAGTLKIPMISFMSAAAFLTNREVYPTFYQTVPGDDRLALVIADLLRNYNYHVVGLIHSNDVSGVSLRDAFVNACGLRNIRVRTASFDSTKRGRELESSVRNALISLVRENLNVIVRTTRNAEQEISFAKAAVEEEWIQGKLHIGRLPSTSVESLMKSATAFKDGEHYLNRLLKGSLSVFASHDLTNPNLVRLKEAWNRFDANLVNSYLPNGTTSKGYSYKIPYDYFMKRDMPRAFAAAYDSVIALGLAACGPNQDLNANMKHVHFMGTRGLVSLDQPAAHSHQGYEFVLDNLVVNYSAPSGFSSVVSKQVGKFVDGNWTIEFNNIVYSDGTNRSPIDKEPPKHVIDTLPFGAKVLGWCESCLTILCCLWVISHLIRNGRKFSPPNQELSGILFWMMILGSILLSLSLIPLTLETNGGCMAYLWLLSLGFALIVGALICKAIYVLFLWRTEAALFKKISHTTVTIVGQRSSTPTTATLSTRSPVTSTLSNTTFNNGKIQQAVDVSTVLGVPSDVHKPKCLEVKIFGPLMVLILGFVALLTTWQVIEPNVYRTVVLFQDMDGNPLFSTAQCTSASSSLSHPFTVAIVTLIGAIILIAFSLSMSARNAPKELAYDIKATLVAGVCILQVYCIALPSLTAAWKTSLGHFLVDTSVSFMVCLIVIFTMFVPKVLNWKLTSLTFPSRPMRSSNQDNVNNTVSPAKAVAIEDFNAMEHERYPNGHTGISNLRSTSLVKRTTRTGETKHRSNVVVQFDFDPSQYDSSMPVHEYSQKTGGFYSVFSAAQDIKMEPDAISSKTPAQLPGGVSSPSVRQSTPSLASSPSRLQLTRSGSNGLENLDSIISSKRRLPAFVNPNELLMNVAVASTSSSSVAVNGLLRHSSFPTLQGSEEINALPNFTCKVAERQGQNAQLVNETEPSNTDNEREEDHILENV